jgi:hypothetical protein
MTEGEPPASAAAPVHPEVEKLSTRIRTEVLHLSDFAGLSVADAGEVIRNEPVEHALIFKPNGHALLYVKSWPATPKEVTIPMRDMHRLPGNVFVHNHPGNESFSYQDVWLLLRHRVREVRAYGPKRGFVMGTQPEMQAFTYETAVEGLDALIATYRKAQRDTTPAFKNLVRDGTFTEDEAWAAQTHAIMRTISQVYGFAYRELYHAAD